MAMTANFIMVLLPFYASKISPYSPQETLLWVGLIMGVHPFVVMIASNFWGVLTSRFSPKLLFLRGLLANLFLFLLMGFTTSLHVLFVLRVIQGIFGGISTVGLIIISSSSTRERISADIGFFQAFLTFGQLVGPPIGTLAASVFGYRGAFVSVSIFLLIIVLLSYFNVKEVPLQPKQEKLFGRSILNRQTIVAWMLCFAATVQLMFLPSILPNVLETFQMEKAVALKWAGIVIMLYTGTTTLGTYALTRLSSKIGRDRMILFLIVMGSLFQALLSLSRGLVDFIAIRMIQTGLIAATVPLVISIFATELKGATIGFVNSARFAGNAFGPMIATSVLAISNLPTLYLFISGLTLVALLAFKGLSKSASPTQ